MAGPISRRHALQLTAVGLASAWPAMAAAPAGGARPDDMTLGDPAARVTVVEYASASCPHCARFNNNVFPEFRKKYIDTGKVHYVFREFLTQPVEVAMAGFLLARCAGKDNYFKVTDAVYRAQDQIYEPGSETIRPAAGHDVLLHIAQSVGLSEDQFNKCINDEKGIQALQERVDRLSKEYKVDSTPTFVVNGKALNPGAVSMADLDAAIQPHLK